MTDTKVLGLHWDPRTDMLRFGCRRTTPSEWTTAGVHGMVPNAYDPRGFIGPHIFTGKHLMRETLTATGSWAAEVPDPLLKQWKKWCAGLELLAAEFSVPRWYGCQEQGVNELQVFGDASEYGFGAVAYLRVLQGDKWHSCLLASRNRLSPLKAISVQKLELQGAVMAVRLADQLLKEMTVNISKVVFHLDSQVALAWVASNSKKYKTFVALRISEIQDFCDGPEFQRPGVMWRHIPGVSNPADLVTRPINAEEFLKRKDLWLHGPELLSRQNDKWPPASSSGQKVDLPPEDFKKVLRCLQNTVVRILRWRTCIGKPKDKVITAKEIEDAMVRILKVHQEADFKEEVEAVSMGQAVKRNSRLKDLDLFVDEKGLLRVKGRLERSLFPDEMVNPVVLGGKDHLCELLINYAHDRVSHLGYESTLAELRTKYHMLRGRTRVRQVLRECRRCRKFRRERMWAPRAPLHPNRLEGKRPFELIGVDCFGPFSFKNNKKQKKVHKRWGLVMVCLVTRAIHLEPLESMSKESFLLALDRCIGRRGTPKDIYCDQGSNFTGAKRELVKLFLRDGDHLKEGCTKRGVEMHFNPAGGPHWGGSWERQIRTIKSCLTKSMQITLMLTDEAFHTILVKAEGILNNRPLAVGDDGESVTPGSIAMQGVTTAGEYPLTTKSVLKTWKKVHEATGKFWTLWRRQYLANLNVQKCKVQGEPQMLQLGDVVAVSDEDAFNSQWTLGKVSKLYKSPDGYTRAADVDVLKEGKRQTVYRPLTRLSFLESSSF